MDNTTKQRAYDIAKGWLSDPEWIAANLERIAPHASQALAKCFKDIGDDEPFREVA